MTKIEAVTEIIRDARRDRSSKASLKRLRRAGKQLGLNEDEQRELESVLEYRPSANEEVYQFYRDTE